VERVAPDGDARASPASQTANVTGTAAVTLTYTDQLGKIVINKRDKLNNNLVGGATFSISPNPFSCHGGSGAFSVTDNDSNDANSANGVIEIDRVCLSTPGYTVTETVPPTGYTLPSNPTHGPIALTSATTITFTFFDPPKLRLLVTLVREDDGTTVISGVDFNLSSPSACSLGTSAATEGNPGTWHNLTMNCGSGGTGYDVSFSTPDP